VEAADRFLKRLPLDEAHGVAGLAGLVEHQAVDGHHAGVLQPRRDLRLAQEARPTAGVMGVLGPDALEGHVSAQLRVAGDVDLAQAAPGVEAHRTVPAGAGLRSLRRARVRPGVWSCRAVHGSSGAFRPLDSCRGHFRRRGPCGP
jgi:hypothetical protein